uniref:pygopus homolog 2-like isoform X1 n=2 Tax=Myxine glutinosa TaxID=7769 RepID=UPI00358E4050
MSAEQDKEATSKKRQKDGDPDGKDLYGATASPEKKKRRSSAQGPAPLSEFAPPLTPMVDHLVASNPFDDDFVPTKVCLPGFVAARGALQPPGSYFRMPGALPPRMPYAGVPYSGPSPHHLPGPQPPFPPGYVSMSFPQGSVAGPGAYGNPVSMPYGPRGPPVFHRGAGSFSPPHGPIPHPTGNQNFTSGPNPAFTQGCVPPGSGSGGTPGAPVFVSMPAPGMNFVQGLVPGGHPAMGPGPGGGMPGQGLPQGNGQGLNHMGGQSFGQGLSSVPMSQSPSPTMGQLLGHGMRLNNGLGGSQPMVQSPGPTGTKSGPPGMSLNSQSPNPSVNHQPPTPIVLNQNSKSFGQGGGSSMKSQDSNNVFGPTGESSSPGGAQAHNSNQTVNSGQSNNGTHDAGAPAGTGGTGNGSNGGNSGTGGTSGSQGPGQGLSTSGPMSCSLCLQEVVDGQEALPCEAACHRWFHRKCAGLTELAYKLLMGEDCAVWACDACLVGSDAGQHRLTPTLGAQPSPAANTD